MAAKIIRILKTGTLPGVTDMEASCERGASDAACLLLAAACCVPLLRKVCARRREVRPRDPACACVRYFVRGCLLEQSAGLTTPQAENHASRVRSMRGVGQQGEGAPGLSLLCVLMAAQPYRKDMPLPPQVLLANKVKVLWGHKLLKTWLTQHAEGHARPAPHAGGLPHGQEREYDTLELERQIKHT